jgi:hypothetical protein
MITITISSETIYNTTALDGIARAVLGADTTGISIADESIIHLVAEANTSTQNKAQKIFDNWGNLSPVASVSTMVVEDSDPTITQDSPDDELEYVVLLDGKEYSQGTVSVIAGSATLTLADPEEGVYDIYFARTSGNFASGHATITVTET